MIIDRIGLAVGDYDASRKHLVAFAADSAGLERRLSARIVSFALRGPVMLDATRLRRVVSRPPIVRP
jgi:hypothetical protein